MAHSNIDAKARTRAKSLHRELTKAERDMWNRLRDFRPRGARYRRETPIGPCIADFAWLSAPIVVEVDGDSHETDQGRRHDGCRDAGLDAEGIKVLRSDNLQILDDRGDVFLTIEAEIASSLKPEGATP